SSVPANNLQEFVAYAKARPGQLNFASPGVGMPHHLAIELLKQLAGLEFVHVPYKGGAPATQDLVGGRVQAMFGTWVIFGPHVQSGRLKAIAASSTTRVAQAPEVRTIAEQGYPGFDMMSWTGLLAPAGTPTEVVARLASETQAILAAPEAKERLLKLGLESPPVVSPAAFAGQVKTDVAKRTKVIRDANIKPE
ncbi:MAG: tripartite tricarboxylate transporter substrate binding protein, partial [Betaproteobacteria bacterium]|nr:tripartite tricarboxylate transporter substrate binding protein [Betaproteobacteria bacterium]